jgi:Kdo2-lipid IVA lauroyltransferase/acyltransferase
MLWIEILQNFRLGHDFFAQHFRVHNWETVEQARAENKGIIFLTGHFGNYEWLGGYIGHNLAELHIIEQRIKNPRVHDFLQTTRSKIGARLLDRRESSRKGIKLLLAKKNLGIVADQDARGKGIFVDFFNIPSSTAAGAAYFHLRTGAPIIFCLCRRIRWGEFELHFERLPDFSAKPINDQNLYLITQLHTSLLENWVRRFPGQYFWTHRRWKTCPTAAQWAQYRRHKQENEAVID